MTETRTEADAIIETVSKLHEPIAVELFDAGDEPIRDAIAIPRGLEIKSLKAFADEYRTAPERKQGTATLADLASFVAHANRFKDPDSAIFADVDPKSPSLTSVIDYHRPGEDGSPRFGRHRGIYRFPISLEWKRWTEVSGQWLTQGEFAQFLEARIQDVADPSTALEAAQLFIAGIGGSFASAPKLQELSRGLTVRVEQQVANAQVLASGEVSMQFVSKNTDEQGAPLKIPTAALLVIPVFRSGAVYQVPARILYRTKGPSIVWAFVLETDRIFDHAIKEACDLAQRETGLPLFLGSPEA